MSKALFDVLKYNFYHIELYHRARFNSDFHHDSKNVEKMDRKPRMSHSANGRNLWNLDSDCNFPLRVIDRSRARCQRGREGKILLVGIF